jgi:hypothetical protein
MSQACARTEALLTVEGRFLFLQQAAWQGDRTEYCVSAQIEIEIEVCVTARELDRRVFCRALDDS